MAANSGEFIGFNTAGAATIVAALDAYIKKINSVSFSATAQETQVFAKGSASYNAMMTMFRNTDQQMANLVNSKLTPLRTRINELSAKYKSNDQNLATAMNNNAKSILKS